MYLPWLAFRHTNVPTRYLLKKVRYITAASTVPWRVPTGFTGCAPSGGGLVTPLQSPT